MLANLTTWLQNYGQIVLFFAQLLFWLVVAVAALWSTMLFKRLVDSRIEAPAASEATDAAPAEKPSVDEFVD